MKIGIYGGSYNPIHIGHTSLANSLVQQGLVDDVWLLVSPLNPFKQSDTTTFAPYDDRYRMTQLAVEGIPHLHASDFENHLPVPSYMYTTLCALADAYPEHEFCLVIGADNWVRFSEWYEYESILSRFSLLVYRRPGYDLDECEIDSFENVLLVDTPLYDISSTQLRHAIRNDLPTDEWICPEVVEYIKDKGLYR